jgi:ParB/RepB/Spo0J family partition protein
MTCLSGQRLEYIETQSCVTLRRNPQFLTPSQMTALKDSITRDGFVAPILVRQSGEQYEILSGNHRWMAAMEVGLPVIPAVIIEPSSQQASRLAVNLNTVHGDPPVETLAPFLAEMDDDTLQTVHVDEETARQLTLFDASLAQRLAALEAPDEVNHASKPNTIPDCKCPNCGKLHARARKASASS